MDLEGRFELVASYATEIVTAEELRALFDTSDRPTAYIGFEPSGRLHAGNVITANMVRRLQLAGCEVTIFLADWHAMINDKFGGDMEAIRACGEYQRQAFLALGVDAGATRFRWASDLVSDPTYWERVVRVAKASTLSRVRRALTIMGRKEDDADVDASKLLYPAMQVADIFHLGAQIAVGGMDQRKAHMLARDVCEKTGWAKPVAVHTPLLGSLKGGERMDAVEGKMSKSDPGASVTLNDTPEEIRQKVEKAFCPKVAEGNPVLDIFRYLVFESLEGKPLTLQRPDRFGGDLELASYAQLEERYVAGEIHPGDLKAETARRLEAITAPVREHFAAHPDAMGWVQDGGRPR